MGLIDSPDERTKAQVGHEANMRRTPTVRARGESRRFPCTISLGESASAGGLAGAL